jgi:uncharacterized protein (DUF2252 family)
LREDHRNRIARRSEGAAAKVDKLAGSVFSFFRGTCLLFHRDMAGEDATMPTVFALGDVHPGNFGVMPSADNVPIFGVNDFDEAQYAPFTWDLKRGAVGFLLAAEEEGGHGPSRQRAIARVQRTQLVNADVFYGAVEFEDRSYVTRERSPFRDDVDLDDLSKKEWKADARICGRAFAHAHALADEAGDVEPQIVAAIGPPDLFVDDGLRFAEEAAARVRADHEHFRADHALGAFRTMGPANL